MALVPLTILHSNDIHASFVAEGENLRVGGVARLSGYVNAVRAVDPDAIYAIAGDMVQGSLIDSEFRGISTLEIMNMVSPTVAYLMSSISTDVAVCSPAIPWCGRS